MGGVCCASCSRASVRSSGRTADELLEECGITAGCRLRDDAAIASSSSLLHECLRRAAQRLEQRGQTSPLEWTRAHHPTGLPTRACIDDARARYEALAPSLQTGDVVAFQWGADKQDRSTDLGTSSQGVQQLTT